MKRLRAAYHINESDVCDACSKKKICQQAFEKSFRKKVNFSDLLNIMDYLAGIALKKKELESLIPKSAN